MLLQLFNPFERLLLASGCGFIVGFYLNTVMLLGGCSLVKIPILAASAWNRVNVGLGHYPI